MTSQPSSATCADLTAAGLDVDDVVAVLRRGLAEDLGAAGDITSAATVSEAAVITATYVTRQPGVVAGLPVIQALIDVAAAATGLTLHATDGDSVSPGDCLAEITGPAREVLAVERLSLNLLGHLSGIATITRQWVDAVAGTGAVIRDTRKTTPGLRNLEKYAVRCGGGTNHRRGLDDAVLIKDNHVAAAGGVAAALDRATAAHGDSGFVIQVEVDNLDQLAEALAHGASEILLDNFDVPAMTAAVELVRGSSASVRLEASGGLQLDNARAVALTGVDYLAVGGLTHSAPALDIGLDTRLLTPSSRPTEANEVSSAI